MAHTSIAFTPKVSALYTIAELNALFAQIKAVVDAKLDIRGDSLGATLEGAAESVQVINILPTSEIETQ